jgi:hypothetical protein
MDSLSLSALALIFRDLGVASASANAPADKLLATFKQKSLNISVTGFSFFNVTSEWLEHSTR